MSGESFGMNPFGNRAAAANINKPTTGGVNGRMRIEDNFLDEEDEELESIRASRESGEIDPQMWK